MPHYAQVYSVVFDRCSDTVVATRFELIFPAAAMWLGDSTKSPIIRS